MNSALSALIKPFVKETGGLLRALHVVQETEGYIDAAIVPVIADMFNTTKAEVKGVISFYEDFRRAPAGTHIVKVCQAEACQAVGAGELTTKLQEAVGISLGETTASGGLTIEPVYCLGLCASGPAALVDGKPRARLDSDIFAREVKALEEAGS